jgi:hypothetical protein
MSTQRALFPRHPPLETRTADLSRLEEQLQTMH